MVVQKVEIELRIWGNGEGSASFMQVMGNVGKFCCEGQGCWKNMIRVLLQMWENCEVNYTSKENTGTFS